MRVLPVVLFFLILNTRIIVYNTESMVDPRKLMLLGSSYVENDEIKVIFTVYEYSWLSEYQYYLTTRSEYQATALKFNLTIINHRDCHVLEEYTWNYFNAEILNADDEYLGKVRDDDDEKILFFLAENGTHLIHWLWDFTVINEAGSTKLEDGRYKIRGVFTGFDYTLKTEAVEVNLKLYKPPLSAVERYINYRNAWISAAFGVLVSGFIQHFIIKHYYPESANWPSRKRMITVLWVSVIIFSTLLLVLSSEFAYDVIRIINEMRINAGTP